MGVHSVLVVRPTVAPPVVSCYASSADRLAPCAIIAAPLSEIPHVVTIRLLVCVQIPGSAPAFVSAALDIVGAVRRMRGNRSRPRH